MDAASEDRVDLVLVEPERLTGGDPELVGDEVPTGGHLGDGMLDLEPGIHLQEVEPIAVEQELAGSGVDVPDGPGQGQCRIARVGRGGPRRPPGTAFPRAPSGGGAGGSSPVRPGERPDRAVEQDLDLDVAGASR